MFKLFFVLSIFVMSATSFAGTPPPVCACKQTFEDHIGNQTEITLRVVCPAVSIFKLECDASIGNKEFTTTCANPQSGETYNSTVSLSAWSKPVGGLTYCEIN